MAERELARYALADITDLTERIGFVARLSSWYSVRDSPDSVSLFKSKVAAWMVHSFLVRHPQPVPQRAQGLLVFLHLFFRTAAIEVKDVFQVRSAAGMDLPCQRVVVIAVD